ncbi:MAG: pyridoxamine 5'-phosphate oxidase family protein [Actinobacteria bacterium]|nr:pyridoxamine 5'-phosphate oxidase family protein [Actinomycetota bacterium]
MAGKRDQIKLSDEEIAAYIAEAKTVTAGTNGPRGIPHLMPLWFVPRGDEIWGWTFAKSQKAINLERDPRATLLFEDGVQYDKLRGVMIECDVELLREAPDIRQIGIDLFTKYGDGNYPADPVIEMIEAQTPKRVGLRFLPRRYVSWDHRKLGGVY